MSRFIDRDENVGSDAAAVVGSFDLRETVDDGPLNRSRLAILFLIFLAFVADGYDITIISILSPAIVNDFGVSSSAMGPVFSAGLFGMIAGAASMTPVADAFGRRPAMLLSTGLSALAMLGTTTAQNIEQLAMWRFVTGVCIGAIAPIGLVLAGEYAPRRMRATAIACMILGIGVGGTGLAAWLSTVLLPNHNWRALFGIGGVLALAITFVLIIGLPESLKFLYTRRAGSPKLLQIVSRLNSSLPIGPRTKFHWSGERVSAVVPYRLLFAGGRQLITPVLWAAMFCSQAITYALLLWLPSFLDKAGVGTGTIGATVAMQSACSTLGGILIARLIDRYGTIMLAALPLFGIPLVLVAGSIEPGSALFLPLVVMTGFPGGGALQGLLIISGFFYPTAIRATAVGAASFISRFGSVLGPYLVAVLMANSVSMRGIFYACTLPLFLTGILIIFLSKLEQRNTAVRAEGAQVPQASEPQHDHARRVAGGAQSNDPTISTNEREYQ